MAKRENNQTTSYGVVVSDDTDRIFAVDVEIKVAGVDLKELSSDDKVFEVNGRQHPISRFGSWVFQEEDSDVEKQICIDGGIIASLTWGLQQICSEIDVWVKDVKKNSFSLQMKEAEKRPVLEEIAKGEFAKKLETTLRKGIPSIYGPVRIVLVKILGKSTQNASNSSGGPSSKETFSRLGVLRDLECISQLMSIQEFGLAYARLKQLVEGNISDCERVQMLLRLGTCCSHLNKDKEMKETALRVLKLTEKMEDSSPILHAFVEDLAVFAEQLEKSGMFTSAAEIMLGCNKLIHKIKDPDELLKELLANLMMCCSLLKIALSKNPMLGIRDECQKYVRKIGKEVQFMKELKECDRLGQARGVYYCLHMIDGLKKILGEPVSKSNKATPALRFSCTESTWADFTVVLSLAEEYQDIAEIYANPSFLKRVQEISENPALLEKRIMDPRIAKINSLLNRDLYQATPMTGFTRNGLGRFEAAIFESLIRESYEADNPKVQALKEKEKGNEAYKKKEYEKALKHYDRAIELDPTDALLHSNKASVYISKNQLSKAKKSCLTALQVEQSKETTDEKVVAKILARLARVEHLSHHYAAALSFYQKSLRLHNDTKVRQQMEECSDEANAVDFLEFVDL